MCKLTLGLSDFRIQGEEFDMWVGKFRGVECPVRAML